MGECAGWSAGAQDPLKIAAMELEVMRIPLMIR